MKNSIKTVAAVLVIVGLTAAGVGYMSFVTERKDSRNKYVDFYEEEQDFDVLFVGQSRMLNAVFPMELWQDYGIVSYNLSGHGNRTATNYWLLKNALEYTSPQLVVIDCGLIQLEEKIGTVEQLHLSLDHIPMSQTKVDMIEDLLGDSDQKGDFLWKFSTYHNRWNTLTGEDFVPVANPEKGAEARVGVAVPDKHNDFGDEKLPKETISMEYLRKMIEELKEQEIEVLLTYIPCPDPSGWQIEANTVWDIANEYGVNYLDFNELFAQINIATDCYDPNAHLNPSGGWKITDYIGNYIVNNYAIEDHREDFEYDGWHEDFEVYRDFKWDKLKNEEEIKSYLSLLYDKDVSFGLWLKYGSEWLDNTAMVQLLGNIGINIEDVLWEDVFMVADRAQDRIYRIRMNEVQDTSMGEVGLRINFDTAAMIFDWNGGEYKMGTEAEAGIMVWDRDTGELIDFAQLNVETTTSQRKRNE